MSNPNEIRLAGIEMDSIVDGPGFRMTFFVQGCPHHCKGCHNPGTHAFDGGRVEPVRPLVEKIFERAQKHEIDGITLSGGEPFEQVDACVRLANAAHTSGLSVWCYTGYLYEELLDKDNCIFLLDQLDVLIDGRFEIDKKSLALPFRGSWNQRIIDVQQSLKKGCAIRYDGK